MSISIAVRKFNIVKLIFSKFKFNENIKNIILCFYWNILDYKKKVLLDWININKIQWNSLSKNIYAYDLKNGNLLWEDELPFISYGCPIIASYEGSFYLIIDASGGRKFIKEGYGDAIVAYKLK